MESTHSRRDTSKSVFGSDARSFSLALFPALMCTHLYNLFKNAVQMGRDFSWQGAPLDQNCFCLNFKTVPLWSIHSKQEAVESSSWALKTISYFCSAVWINLEKARIWSGKVVLGKVQQIRKPPYRWELWSSTKAIKKCLHDAAQRGQIRANLLETENNGRKGVRTQLAIHFLL